MGLGWFPQRPPRPLKSKRSKQKRISPQEYRILLQEKDLRIASLEGLLEDKKRESLGLEAKILRRWIRLLHRQLERIETRYDGI